jgi:hypothetical protein
MLEEPDFVIFSQINSALLSAPSGPISNSCGIAIITTIIITL